MTKHTKQEIQNNQDNQQTQNNEQMQTSTEKQFNIEQLIEIKEEIEKLEPIYHFEVFKILLENNINYNENNNGIFILMNSINGEVINKIKQFIEYANNQKISLEEIEQQKLEYKNILMDNNKDETFLENPI